jgi:molybdate transport system substrate-binding protein
MQRITLPALAAAVVQLLIAASADAADLKLFGGGHFQGSGQPLVEAFSRKAGIIASYTPGNTGGPALKRRLDAGEMMDVIVMNRDDMDHQVEAGLIRRDTVVDFARDGMGVAVRKGAPKPDISTRDKFRAALLAAKAVGLQDPDPAHHSGMVVRQMLVDLGILNEVMQSAVIIKDSYSDLVAGKADLGIWALPELLAQTKVDVVGPVPIDLGGFTTQSVGILTSSENAAAAGAFIEFLNSSDGRAIWTKNGLLPLQRAPD